MIRSAALPVLTFHDLSEEPSVISFSPRLFQSGMAKLHGLGYQVLGLLDVVEALQSGTPFPDRSLAITFDDGYRSVYGAAFPILRRHDMTATVFLTTGDSGSGITTDRLTSPNRPPMLSWVEIREMQRYGISFGAHTLTHPDLRTLPTERVEAEMLGSKEIIEQELGVPVRCFAYPFGRFDRRSRAIAQRHFACACSDRLGIVRFGSDPYALERVDAYYLRTATLFALMPTALFPWYVRACSVPRAVRRAAQDRGVKSG
jgi:peptidoglycan/xylan/chitin deacetylase (PgdA/CDA1 family)